MLVRDTDEMHGEVPGARLGHLLPSPQSRELYIGSSVPALGNRVIYQGGAARRADTMQLFVRSVTAKRKQPRQEPALARMLGWGGQRGSSAEETQFVKAPAICRHIPPCSRAPRCWNKA